jgi:hypothetical protein
MVVDAINRADMDLRKSLFGNIVLSGGSTVCKGFGDRLLHEVQRLAVKDMRIKIFAPPERKYSTWIGGSILAGLSTFRKVSLHPSCRPMSFMLTRLARCGSILMTGMRIQILYTQSSHNEVQPAQHVGPSDTQLAISSYIHCSLKLVAYLEVSHLSRFLSTWKILPLTTT